MLHSIHIIIYTQDNLIDDNECRRVEYNAYKIIAYNDYINNNNNSYSNEY